MRAAFTRGSERGWIFVEATMNSELQSLLLLTPGIIHSNRIPVKFPIDLEDRVAAITLPKGDRDRLEVGQWACIIKGNYRGDVGLVAEVEAWGVRLLVVPRLQLLKFVSCDFSTLGKR